MQGFSDENYRKAGGLMQSARRDEPFQPDGKRNSRDLEDGHEYQLPCRHGLEDYFEASRQIYDERFFKEYRFRRPCIEQEINR